MRIMRKINLIGILLFSSVALFAQSISEKEMQDIRSSFKAEGQTKAIQNILTTNKDITGSALNHDLDGQIDHFFKYRVKVNGITNQYSSGRCWMFTSMNQLRPGVMEKYNLGDFDFSHNYLYFWDIFEKSNLFLENIIASKKESFDDRAIVEYFKSPVGDGGVWNLYYNIGEKYGTVPQDVMPETVHSNNTRQLTTLVNERLRAGGYLLKQLSLSGKKDADLRDEKYTVLKDVYRILALCLGEPPTTFTWRYKDRNGNIRELKDYTPKQFYKEITPADFSPENYIMIMNDPTREYYKLYEIQNYKNTIEGINWVYLNLPNEDIKKAALASIKNNEAMYISCDVGKYMNREAGILDPDMYNYEDLLGVKVDMDKKARILTRQSGSSHAMLLIGCDTDGADRPIKWEVENSWGASAGNKGYLTMTDNWFNEYMFRFVIRRNYLDSKAIDALNQKPIQLPVWDYMN